MSATLTQNEVDALMEALHDGQIDTKATADPGQAAQGEIKSFDLVSRDRVVRGRMSNLDAIQSRLARRLGKRLSDLCGTEVEVNANPAVPQKLGEFLSYQMAPTCLNLISLTPLQGTALLCVPPNLFYSMLNLAFGGKSTGDGFSTNLSGRDFTPLEISFAQSIVKYWSEESTQAWAEIISFRPAYVRTEISPNNLSIAPPSEVFMATTFEVHLEHFEGRMDFAIPYHSLDPLIEQLGEPQVEESQEDRAAWQTALKEVVLALPVRFRVELGRANMRLKGLLALQEGDVVRLDSHPGAPQAIYFGDRFKALGMPFEQNGNLAVEFLGWRTT